MLTPSQTLQEMSRSGPVFVDSGKTKDLGLELRDEKSILMVNPKKCAYSITNNVKK